MSKTKDILLEETYDKFIHIALSNGPVVGWDNIIDPEIMAYGTAVDEKYFTIKETRDLIIRQKEQLKTFDYYEYKLKPVYKKMTDSGNFALFITEVDLTTGIKNEHNTLPLRLSTILEYRNSTWKIIHWHGSIAEHIAGDDDPWHVNEWKQKNDELLRLVDEKTTALENKNRELEIETALEKVRSVAMGMQQPADMLDVCKAISLQLQSLGVKEIRNVQTAIFYKDRDTYMNYEYYAKHKKTFITETTYTNNKLHHEFAIKMMKGKGECFVTHIKDLNEWLAYQKSTNVFIDNFLETASSLSYYWFSLGPVALGISTYIPLSQEELDLFNRFLTVFELAYRRFLDIVKAEAQAREARIETSLERIRATAMSMQKIDELLEVVEIINKELHALGIPEIRNTSINIFNNDKEKFLNYEYSEYNGKTVYEVDYNSHPSNLQFVNRMREHAEDFMITEFTGNDLDEWKLWMKNQGQKLDSALEQAHNLYYYDYSIGLGSIGISTFNPINKGHLEVLNRIRNVFNLAYRRYADIALAEVQAREAQIETSLERVRAMAMAMHTSEDLSSTVEIFFKQLKVLGIIPIRCGVGQIDGTTCTTNLTTTTSSQLGDSFEVIGKVKQTGHPVLDGIFENWKLQKEYHPVLEGDDIKAYYGIMNRQINYPEFKEDVTQYGNMFYFKQGFVFAWTEKELSEEELKIFRRFASVLSLTYRRYLDLKETEAQAREAQIETALERVRSRTMAMHQSTELSDAGNMVFQQIRQLGVQAVSSWFWFIDTESDTIEIWTTHEDKLAESVKVKALDLWTFKKEIEAWKNHEPYLKLGLPKMEAKKALRKIFGVTINTKNDAAYLHLLQIRHKYGFLGIGTWDESTEEEISICSRFTKVFEQTYTRFLDLKKAEAQAREAQIEAGLERARAQSMMMQHSKELDKTCQIFHKQLHLLGIESEFSYLWLPDEEKMEHLFWATWLEEQQGSAKYKSKRVIYPLDKSEPAIAECYVAWESGRPVHVNPVPTADVEAYFKDWAELFENVEKFKPKYYQDGLYYVDAYMKYGCFGIMTRNKLSDDEEQILHRFSKEFERTYTRFLDLQKAEAQAREAQIEAALERVRARTMAMQHSDELSETAYVLFQQFDLLGVTPEQLTIGIVDEKEQAINFWETRGGKLMDEMLKSPVNEPVVIHKVYSAWKERKKSLVIDLSASEIEEYNSFFKNIPGLEEEYEFKSNQIQNRRVIYSAFFSKGLLALSVPEPIPEESIPILQRFAKVFEQTYTRFLDLQKAEAQAREARIELALERIRAQVTAMRESSELLDIVVMMQAEFTKLGHEAHYFWHMRLFRSLRQKQQRVHLFVPSPAWF